MNCHANSFPCMSNTFFIDSWGPGHTTPEKLENAALFLRLGATSIRIRHENAAFQNRFSNRRNLKTPAFRFNVDGKQFGKRSFSKTMKSQYSFVFRARVSLKHKAKTNGDCRVFIFSRAYCGRKTFDAVSEWKRRFQISPVGPKYITMLVIL